MHMQLLGKFLNQQEFASLHPLPTLAIPPSTPTPLTAFYAAPPISRPFCRESSRDSSRKSPRAWERESEIEKERENLLATNGSSPKSSPAAAPELDQDSDANSKMVRSPPGIRDGSKILHHPPTISNTPHSALIYLPPPTRQAQPAQS